MITKNSQYRNATGNLTPPPGYTQVAQEGETKVFTIPTNIAYGANGIFAYRNNVQGTIIFSPSTFGYDPVRQVVKGGYAQTSLLLSDSALIPVETTTPASSTSSGLISGSQSPQVDSGATTGQSSSGKYLIYAGLALAVIAGVVIYKKMKKH